MAGSSLFWKLISRRYLAAPVPDEEIYQQKLRATQKRFRPDWDILEIGCGSGNTAIAHAPHVRSVMAVDYSNEMMDPGRARLESEGIDNVTFRRKAFEELGTDVQYDAVLMLSFIHLIPNWRGAIRKAFKLTKPNGIFVSSTATLSDAGLVPKLLAPVMRPFPFLPNLAVFSHVDLVREIGAAGFDIELDWRPHEKASVFIIARKPGLA